MDDFYTQKMIYPNIQADGIFVSFWGCFSYFGFVPIVILEGRVDTVHYCHILENHLLPEVDGIQPLFMQDGAIFHTSQFTKSFLRSKYIELYPYHCPQSPDMNSID
eukprot:NODE_146_length_15710_cov_0.617385.p8 type:complete len:106 gc:universal NODE_146_length_15710_cov_0.617385:3194-3511(+)